MGRKRSTSTLGTGIPNAQGATAPGMVPRSSKGATATKTTNMRAKTAAKSNPYARKRGGHRAAQGGEAEASGLAAGRSRTNKGKNHLTGHGSQGFRGY